MNIETIGALFNLIDVHYLKNLLMMGSFYSEPSQVVRLPSGQLGSTGACEYYTVKDSIERVKNKSFSFSVFS